MVQLALLDSSVRKRARKELKRTFRGPSQKVVGPRLENFSVQGADEGDPIIRCFGPKVRTNGVVIWASNLEEVASSQKIKSKGGNVTQTEFDNFVSVAVAICEGFTPTINKIYADGKIFFDFTGGGGLQRFSALRFHFGADGQSPDPIIQGAEGIDNTPAFNDITYMVIERLNLADFGGRIPAFSFEIAADGSLTSGTLIQAFLDELAFEPSEYDIAGATKTVQGALFTSPSEAKESIQLVMEAYQLRAKAEGEKLVFIEKGTEESVTVLEADLGARSGNSEELKKIQIGDQTEEDLPREINLEYYDRENAFNKGSISARRAVDKSTKKTGISLPFSLTATEAREIVERQLWEAWNERKTFSLELPPKYLKIQETDLVELTFEGNRYRARVESVEIGFNFVVTLELIIQSISADLTVSPPFLVIVNPPVDSKNPFNQSLYSPPTLIVHLLDLPALREQEATRTGYIYSHVTSNSDDPFLNVDYFERFGTATEFSFLFNDNTQSTIGQANTALSGSASHLYWDEANTVEVTLYRDDLELDNAPDKLSVLQGQNWALLGDEIIGFRSAALIGTRKYRLSGLLRGLRDTDDAMGTHIIGERFILLATTSYAELTVADIGAARGIKVVPAAEDIDNISEVAFTPQGNSFKPFKPTHLQGTRDGSDNLTITWTPRTRAFYRPLSLVPPPPLELSERYEIDIMDGVNVVRTLTASTPNVGDNGSVVYSVADQTTDFGSAQAAVTVKIYKISDTVGRGKAAEATL